MKKMNNLRLYMKPMIHQDIHKALRTAIISAIMFVGSVLPLQAQTNTDGGTVLQGSNALDHRLQRPLPNEYFPGNKIFDHLFITVDGAPTFTHRSDGNFIGKPDLGARGGISVGDWFTPVHGLKLGVSFGQRKEHLADKHQFVGVSLDYMMNLSALALKYNPRRTVEFIGVAGLEYQRRFRTSPHANVFGAHIGLQTRFNVSRYTFLYIEPRLGLYSDGVNTRTSWQRYDWEASVFVGLGYQLSPFGGRYGSKNDSRYSIDNTFYGIMGGANMLFDNLYPRKDCLGGGGSLYFGKWASTISGWRFMATAGAFGLKDNGHPKYAIAEVDYLFNINSASKGFNPDSRFNLNVILGPALGFTSRRQSKVHLGATLGLQGVVNLTDNLQLVVEPKANIFNRHFASTAHGLDALASLSIGFQYRLGHYKDDNSEYDFSDGLKDFLESNKLFMTFSAGLLSRNNSWGKNGGASIGFGRWFSPASAWRLTLNGDYFHKIPRYGDVTLNADYMLSLATLFGGYNPDRVFDLIASAGVHGGAAHYNGGNHAVYGLQAGLQARFNVSDEVDLFVEPQMKTTRAKGYVNSLDKSWRVMLGFNYKFGNHKKDRQTDGADDPIANPNYVALYAGPGIFSHGAKSASYGKVCGGFDVVYGRKLTHVSSVQAGLAYDFGSHKYHPAVTIGTFHADYLLDITQLADCDPDRKFHISALVGAGFGWSNHADSSVGLAAQAGIQFKWKVSPTLDIIAEPRATLWQPRVCLFNGITEHFIAAPKLMLGAAYKF